MALFNIVNFPYGSTNIYNIEKKRKRETHLCNTCALEFATCKSTIIFGDAPTKDNVYKCNAFR